jgi:aminopeptidase N
VYERPRPFRIDHISLDVVLDHPGRSLAGTAELSLVRVDPSATEVKLDAVGLQIASVELVIARKTKKAKFVYDGDVLSVPIAESAMSALVRVRYRAQPRRGMYFLAPDAQVPDRPAQIWTQCQDEDARHIFPCHDKPHIRQTFELVAQAPAGWFVLSNGERVSTPAQERRGRFHYRMQQPMPSYLFTLVAGNFVELDGGKVGEAPISYYVPPGREADGRRTFARTPEMIRLFAKLTGIDYPWTKYAQVVVNDFIFGGMENTGATTMYEHILLDERAALDVTSEDLIAHELAHQWFGDFVTCRDWSHAWLNEGFATYFEQVWREHAHGRDEYEHFVRGDLQAYLSEADSRYRRPVVCQDYDAPIDIFDRHLYEKGALTLHALRLELGDTVFWKGVHAYLSRHRGTEVETRDLQRAMESINGTSLDQFFEQAVHRAGHPRVQIDVEHDAGLLVLHVKQQLEPNPNGGRERPFAFELEVDIAEHEGKKPRRETRRVQAGSETLTFVVSTRPRYVVIDPRLRVIGSVRVKAPADMVRHQLRDAPTARGRTLAAEQLSKRDDPTTIAALAEVLADTRELWMVRSAAASALGAIRSDAAFRALADQAKTRHPKTRRAVVQAIGEFRTSDAVEVLRHAARHDESYLVVAAACRALGSTRQSEAFELLAELVDQPSWGEVVRSATLSGLSKLRDPRGIPLLRERTRYGYPNRGRRTAVGALAELAPTRKSRELLEELLEDSDPYMRVSVVEALGEIGDAKARPALRRQLSRDLDGRVRRRIREVLRDLERRGKNELRRLREEIEQLRREHSELKARMSRLEGRIDKKKK